MKKIDNMTVTVTYTVVLNDVEVPDNVYEGLMSRDEFSEDDIDASDNEKKAYDWLSGHINEHDAMDWFYEIVDID